MITIGALIKTMRKICSNYVWFSKSPNFKGKRWNLLYSKKKCVQTSLCDTVHLLLIKLHYRKEVPWLFSWKGINIVSIPQESYIGYVDISNEDLNWDLPAQEVNFSHFFKVVSNAFSLDHQQFDVSMPLSCVVP